MGPFRGISTADPSACRRGRLYAALPNSDEGQEDEQNSAEAISSSSVALIEGLNESEKASMVVEDQLSTDITTIISEREVENEQNSSQEARIERDHQEQVQEKEGEEEHILEVKRVEDGRVAIRILHLDGKLQNIDCQLSWNLLKLKEKISELSGVTVETQRLIYGGRVLEDDQQLASYKIEQGHTIHLFVRSVQPASENIATVSTSHFPDQRSPRDNVPPLTFVNIANEAISPSVYPSDSLQRVDPLMLDSPLGSAARRIKLWSSFFLIIYSMKAMGQFAAIADDQQNRNDRNRSSYETQYDVLTRPSTIVQCYELFVHVLAVYIGCIGFKAVHDTDIRPIRFYCRGVVWLALLTTLDQVYISLHLYTLTQAGEGYHNVYNARTPPLNEVVSANVLQTLMLIVMWVIAIHHSYVHQAEVVRYNATHLSAAINALPPA